MYCARCNVDFTEGLRYCKWCGQMLEDRRRATGELTACPNCTAPIQPKWTFCKACGARLNVDANPATAIHCSNCGAALASGTIHCLKCGENQTNAFAETFTDRQRPPTSAIAHCPTCGERIEPGTLYCKGCGSALYNQSAPPMLICAACKSQNPAEATTCRACGALLIETPASVRDDQARKTTIDNKQSHTLPDLAEHLPKLDQHLDQSERVGDTKERASEASDVGIESGAHTWILDSTDVKPEPAPEPPHPPTHGKGGGQTSTLPGVAGSPFERPTPTSALEMDRDTGPVAPPPTMSVLPPPTESVLPPPTENVLPSSSLYGLPPQTMNPLPPATSNGLNLPSETEAPPVVTEPVKGYSAPITRINTDSLYSVRDTEAESEEETHQFISEADLSTPETGEGTAAFGSGSNPPHAFQMEEAKPTTSIADELAALSRQLAAESQNAAPPPEVESPSQFSTAPFAPTMHEPTQVLIDDQAAPPAPRQTAPPASTQIIPSASPQASVPWTPVTPDEAKGVVKPPVAPPHQSDTRFVYIIAALVVMVAAVIAWWFLMGRKPVPPPTPPIATNPPVEQPPAPPPTTDKPATPTLPEGMVMVSAGAYAIGRDDGGDLERPLRQVKLPAFFIDKTEVTNADYNKFVDATKHQPPGNWPGGKYPADRANYPVTGITWAEADAYAKWAGKRLPTEAEWEAAARGSDGRRYPWGNDWQSGLANIEVKSTRKYGEKDYPSEIKPVGQYASGASVAGALDMIGNVWEYTADEFNLYPGNPKSLDSITVGPDKRKLEHAPGKTYRVIRGGAYDGDRQHDASYRGLIDDSLPYPKTGFRCVKDMK
jgi:formylglycine-generating enzyme required for sulfatase activity